MNEQRKVEALTDEELDAVSAGAVYMKLDEVKGEVTTNGFKDWIE